MVLAVGSAPVADVRYGGASVAAVHLGAEKVWPAAAGGWESLFYDYWDLADATAGGWPSRRGLLPTLPITSLDADGAAVPLTTLTAMDDSLAGAAVIARITVADSGGYPAFRVIWDHGSGWNSIMQTEYWQEPGFYGHALLMEGPGVKVPKSEATRITARESALLASIHDGASETKWLEPNTGAQPAPKAAQRPAERKLTVEVPITGHDVSRLRFLGMFPLGPAPYDTPEWESFVAWAVGTHGVVVR